MLEDYDRTSQSLADNDYGMRNGPVDDLTFDEARNRPYGAAERYHDLRGRVIAMLGEMRGIYDRPPEWYDAQKALLEAAGSLQGAAQRESGNE